MGNRRISSRITPGRIAVLYLAIGGAWVLSSDQVVAAIVDDPALETQVQTVKGWFFVAVSAAVIYVLVAYSQRELAASNDRLDAAIQQTSVLHRLLRHNLRNTSNIIHASAESLRSEEGVDEDELLEIIVEETNELVELSEKSTKLRQVVLEDATTEPIVEVDLVSVARRRIERVRDAYPNVEFHTDLPETACVDVHSSFELAIDELLENAVEHNEDDNDDDDDPTDLRIDVSIRTLDEAETETETEFEPGTTVLEIADDGTGLPAVERDVLEADIERPMVHSRGLGLWVVRTIVSESGGDLEIVDNDPHGTIARITIS